MSKLAQELLPHSPSHGIYLAPDIPPKKLRNAIRDFARSVEEPDVLALYDATLSGNAKDGAVFTSTGVVFQNNDLSPVQEVRYDDIVGVKAKRKFLGGKKVRLDVNRGRATVPFVIDFSGRPDAAEYVARFLYEAMMQSIESEASEAERMKGSSTDVRAVRNALQELVDRGQLSPSDREAMLRTIDE
ncbi:MAG: hypothetical protein KJO98_00015 [Rhodothermia bacterium]|nr:hypothetical protein [Rhodothermia bacterium]